MASTVNNMTVGFADAGHQARALLIARAPGEGVTPPTFRLLRS